MEHYKSFLKFQQSVRLKWFFNTNNDPFNIDDDYQPKPWDVKTKRSAPKATDAPELVAYLASIDTGCPAYTRDLSVE